MSSEDEYAARVFAARTLSDPTTLTERIEEAFLAGIRWEVQRGHRQGLPCRVCGEFTTAGNFCDKHRYDPCVVCGKTMRRNGQKAKDHPGTVSRNRIDTCTSCCGRSRRTGEYTGDIKIDPEDIRRVTEMINARFAGNDLHVVASALGIDTQTDVH